MDKRLIFVHALSPLHAGTGQGVGVIDLPIAREKATGLPYLPGSSLKGTLRDTFNGVALSEVRHKIFGPDKNSASDHAGAIQFTDQTLLLLPIRSLAGTFAWVTSPYLLMRLKRDASDAGVTTVAGLEIPEPTDEEHCIVNAAASCDLIVSDINKVCLEDLDLQQDPAQAAHIQHWADWLKARIFPSASPWQGMLGRRLCVVHDDVLSFLLNTATEITARVKIKDDDKTVERGGLWYEEALPAETVLFGIVMAFPNQKTGMNAGEILSKIRPQLSGTLQFGGKATVGRGICQVAMVNGATPENGG